MKRPASVVGTLAGAWLVSGVILWSLNIGTLWYVLVQAPISLDMKLRFYVYGYQSLFRTYDSGLSLGIIVVSVLAGINAVMLVRVLQSRRRAAGAGRHAASGGLAVLLAVFGSSCIACGTSLVAPVLATLGASSLTAAHRISSLMLWGSSALLAYSIYRLGLLAGADKPAAHTAHPTEIHIA